MPTYDSGFAEHRDEAVGEVRGENIEHSTNQSGQPTPKTPDLPHSPRSNVRMQAQLIKLTP